MKNLYLLSITSGLAIIIFAGCQAPAPHSAPQVTIRCKIPAITALPETKEAQEKGGVEIAIVPVAHKAVRRERVVMREMQAPFLTLVVVPQAERNQKVYVEQTTSPYLEPDPPHNPNVGDLVSEKRRWSPPSKHSDVPPGFRGWHEAGRLPHRDEPALTQFVTFRLADSFPESLRAEWEHMWKIECNRERQTALEKYLDRARGECHLRHPRIAEIIQRAHR
jgi:hypothetical protein